MSVGISQWTMAPAPQSRADARIKDRGPASGKRDVPDRHDVAAGEIGQAAPPETTERVLLDALPLHLMSLTRSASGASIPRDRRRDRASLCHSPNSTLLQSLGAAHAPLGFLTGPQGLDAGEVHLVRLVHAFEGAIE